MPYAAKQRNTYCTTENTSINHIPVKMFIYQNGQLACFFLYQTFSSKSVLRSTATGKKKSHHEPLSEVMQGSGFVCVCVGEAKCHLHIYQNIKQCLQDLSVGFRHSFHDVICATASRLQPCSAAA